jgi:glycosyltransferase involved in cell wall biosynthesis
LNILLIEPFYTGSHKNFCDQLKKYSKHNIKILSMKGQFWKWRMHGGSIYLANEFNTMDFCPNLILASDMIDLSTFISLCKEKIVNNNIKTALYFHENQLTYPWSKNDRDVKLKRDVHYGFINYTSCMCADFIYYNSNYNMSSYLKALKDMLRNFPDYNMLDTVDVIKNKSKVLDLGLDLKKFDIDKDLESNLNIKDDIPLIVWNHRWEYDKNFKDFLEAFKIMKKRNIKFKLAILGESYSKIPKEFLEAKELFKEEIVAFSKAKSFNDYRNWLYKADLALVTSNQEFFGISFMESIYCNTYPLLPNRLTYPDLLDINKNKEIFYSDFNELINKLEYILKNISVIRKYSFKDYAKKYCFSNIIRVYDEEFEKLI